MTDGEIEARLEARGVESTVYDADESVVGHITMLEYDGALRSRVKADAATLPGPVVVVRSSAGSYHVYGLEVRPWSDVEQALEASRADREYVQEMARRGVATLRTSAKVGPDEEIETEAPVPVGVTMTRPADSRVSRPHLSILREMAKDAHAATVAGRLEALEAGVVDGIEPVGDVVARSRYETRGEL